MKAKTLWIIGVILSLFFGIIYIWPEYRLNHTYYIDMAKDTSNIYLILLALVSAAIPVVWVVYFGKNTAQKLITTFFVWFLVFAIGNVMIKDSLIGNGFLMIVINFGLMIALMLYFSAWFISIGNWIRAKIGMLTWTATDVILNLWLWFGVFVLVNYLLIVANIYYWVVVWALFVINWLILYKTKKELSLNTNFLVSVFDKFRINNNPSISRYISIVLLTCTIMYIFYGLWMSYIPYPTARDANHLYMSVPRMLVNNHGMIRFDNFGNYASTFPVYLSYVAYFFGLFWSFGSKFWINADTVGVVMNFMTAIYTIFVFLALLQAFAQWFGDDEDDSTKLWFDIGRFGILQWMTSGMGAFLVFVDNKSDFGIMFLGAMWLLFGMRYILSSKNEESENSNNINKNYNYNLTLSAIMFALAIVSKPTAIFDAMNFGLLLWWLYFGYFVFAGLIFLIWFVLSRSGLNWVENFFSKMDGNISGVIWAVLSLVWISKVIQNAKYFLRLIWRVAVMWISILILKWPILFYSAIQSNSLSVNTIKSVFLSDTQLPTTTSNGITDPKMCTKWAVWINKSEQLYSNLKDPSGNGYSEDVGRYVWFGQKEFKPGWILWTLIPINTCITTNSTARYLCQNQTKLDISIVQNMRTAWIYDEDFLSGVMAYYENNKNIQTSWSLAQDISKKLTDYMNDKVIYNDWTKILVPYKLLVPLNVSFNRSLQNLSSYYTDIGIFWLFAWIVTIIWFIYGIIIRNKKLILTIGITLIGWIFWIAVWWAIVRYGIGMISWTVISISMTFDLMINNEDEDNKNSNTNRSYIFLMIIVLFGIMQVILNFIRISSQNGWWVFTQYKFSNGTVSQTSATTLQTTNVKKFPYKADDIFNLQFPIYNKILNQVNGDNAAGKMDYNILVAGTYTKYFVNNWKNVKDDDLLWNLAKWFSDGDQCKSYLRLQDKKLKYLIIDPNIASIIMWWGNSSLMDRFFAKIDSQTNKVIQDGTFTMLSKLVSNWYIKLYYTNMLPTKYAYILSDADFSKYFGITDKDQIAITRAKLATIRFWPNEANNLVSKTIPILKERLLSGEWFYDLADMFGKTVSTGSVQPLIDKIVTTWLSANDTAALSKLTDDERLVLTQYYWVYQQIKSGSTDTLTSIMTQSLQWGSQVIVFQVN